MYLFGIIKDNNQPRSVQSLFKEITIEEYKDVEKMPVLQIDLEQVEIL